MKRGRLEELLNKLKDMRIAVVGDLFLDRWFTVDRGLDEPSLETGMAAHQVIGQRNEPGVAGTILKNLAALGAGRLYTVSLLGEDGDGDEVLRGLGALKVDTSLVVRSTQVVTPVYIKPVFTNGGGKPAEGHRLDIKNRSPTPKILETALEQNLRRAAQQADAVIISDQLTEEGTGVVGKSMRGLAAQLAREKSPLLIYADSRAFIHRFRGITLKCNYKEALAATARPEQPFRLETAVQCMEALEQTTKSRVFITCGEAGILVRAEAGEPRLLPAVGQPGPIDVVGAGDACTGGLVGALCAGATAAEAAQLGNLVAGVTVRKIGTTGTAQPGEVLAMYDEQTLQA